jgi:ketosteroid isomerase-like protein
MPDSPAGTTVEIHWVFTPVDFFEERIVLEREGYAIEMDDGRITARMGSDYFDAHPDLPALLRRDIEVRFRGAQLIQRRPFEIDGGSIVRLFPNGQRIITPSVHGVEMVVTSEQVDLVVLDNAGNIIGDTRRNRINTTDYLMQLSARHASDQAVRRMLESFNQSVREPRIELVRLYEVGEAIAEAFGSKPAAAAAFGVSYNRLEALANDRRLRQARHSGQQLEPQRDAITAELDEARGIAREMITKYLEYLERQRPLE